MVLTNEITEVRESDETNFKIARLIKEQFEKDFQERLSQNKDKCIWREAGIVARAINGNDIVPDSIANDIKFKNGEYKRILINPGQDMTRWHHLASFSAYKLIESNKSVNFNGNTPLHYAAKDGYSMLVKTLLTSPSICVNLQNPWGETPLHLALIGRDYNIVVLTDLIKAGCDFSIEDYKGYTPLDIALLFHEDNLVNILLDNLQKFNIHKINKKGCNLIWKAAVWKRYNIYQKLLDMGADPNVKFEGKSALQHVNSDSGYSEYINNKLRNKQIENE